MTPTEPDVCPGTVYRTSDCQGGVGYYGCTSGTLLSRNFTNTYIRGQSCNYVRTRMTAPSRK